MGAVLSIENRCLVVANIERFVGSSTRLTRLSLITLLRGCCDPYVVRGPLIVANFALEMSRTTSERRCGKRNVTWSQAKKPLTRANHQIASSSFFFLLPPDQKIEKKNKRDKKSSPVLNKKSRNDAHATFGQLL